MAKLTGDVAGWEILSRYLNSESFYRKSDNSVKPRAFEPVTRDGQTALSVFRISELANGDIWAIGDAVIREAANPHLHGRADVLASSVRKVGLAVRADGIPVADDIRSRHAGILGWPGEKDKWKSISQQLAEVAQLHIRSGDPASLLNVL